MGAVTRALFINSGILGQRTFAEFVRSAFSTERDGVSVVQVLVTDGLTIAERVMRRLLCARLSPHRGWLANVDLHRFRCELNAGLLARRRFTRLARSGHTFDVLHFHRQATAYASLDLMRRIPSIVSLDTTQICVVQNAGSRLEARSYAPNIRRDGEIFRAARLIVSASEWAARSIREEYPSCATEIAVMPNPVPLPPGSDGWCDERYRRATADAGYRPRVLFIGGDFARKGGYQLLRAWRAARMETRAALDIMSNWPLDVDALAPGVTVHRKISPYTPAWHALLRASDIFVMPTRDEAFGNVYQEAAAAGLPAIGTRINAIPEVVHDGLTGLLVPRDDEYALVGALDALIASPERRRELGARGRASVAASADPDEYRRKLAAAIRRIAGH